jgi:branched-chain amino acid transport system substrate-binding protein
MSKNMRESPLKTFLASPLSAKNYITRIAHSKFAAMAIVMASLSMVSSCTKKTETSNPESAQSSATTSGAPAAVASGDVIKIGEVGSMTGDEASFGISTHQGVELALKQINAAGGVKGKQIVDIALDDQGKPDEAATAVTKLITQNNVVAILGEVASSRSLAMAPIAQRYKIPMISPTSTNPDVTKKGDYIFRACFLDSFQAKVMARFALDNLKFKKVAILRDVKNDYSVGLSNFFTEIFKQSGGTITIDQSYSAGDKDFKAQLTAIRATNPEAIYVPGYYGDVVLIGRQARELGIKAPMMGGDGWDSPKLKEIGGEALNGYYISNHYSTGDKNPKTQDFVAKYKAAYGGLPDSMAALAFDSTYMLVDAMNRAKSLSPSDIRDALATTKDFDGVAGKITMDAGRNPVKSAVVLKVVNGGDFEYVTTVQPF